MIHSGVTGVWNLWEAGVPVTANISPPLAGVMKSCSSCFWASTRASFWSLSSCSSLSSRTILSVLSVSRVWYSSLHRSSRDWFSDFSFSTSCWYSFFTLANAACCSASVYLWPNSSFDGMGGHMGPSFPMSTSCLIGAFSVWVQKYIQSGLNICSFLPSFSFMIPAAMRHVQNCVSTTLMSCRVITRRR